MKNVLIYKKKTCFLFLFRAHACQFLMFNNTKEVKNGYLRDMLMFDENEKE